LITHPINIKIDESDKKFILKKREIFSHAFRKGYKMYSNNSTEIEKYLKNKFGLTDIETRGVVSKIKSQFNLTLLNKKQKEERIIDIIEQINELKLNKDKYKIRDKFKLIKKLNEIEQNLYHDAVFGTKTNLQKISYLSNFKNEKSDELSKYL